MALVNNWNFWNYYFLSLRLSQILKTHFCTSSCFSPHGGIGVGEGVLFAEAAALLRRDFAERNVVAQ